ncbi:putative gnat family protein [Botrytis fragariae]|uniref:Putative gnat family protein n=1 Tax=Botrytis fragariae TaxID=1964551 RepID=A0A8H6B4Y4_9HELO|nr:putative gnat family protein [Botrytis fragariae]KAF5879067.1 putative gnat family protein [Botrytis fragariae]
MYLRHSSSQPVTGTNCTKPMLSSLFALPSFLRVPPTTECDEEELAELREVVRPEPYRIWLMWRPQRRKEKLYFGGEPSISIYWGYWETMTGFWPDQSQ